ncbi:C69 family dipeptidase [Lactobacillus delbrueckii subsp. bulgaricus]|uniref:C69 family dipeptidase n=1 Tax=Lactobacillus delbrueckii TaxID=1584 RepID=UPI0038527C1D
MLGLCLIGGNIMRKFIWAAGALGLAAAFTATSVKACMTVVVGKKATTDGSTLVARNEEAPGPSTSMFTRQPAMARPLMFLKTTA